MPFLSLPSAVRMHYEVLKPDGSTDTGAALDPTRPTLVVLVPFLAVTLQDVPQVWPDSPLHATHQIVAFSPRSHGRTISEPQPQHDPFVSAADLAFAFEALQLPPSPLFAPGSICGRIAVAFAVLFPQLVTALAVVGISGTEAKTSLEGFRTLDATMFNPEEPADLHETIAELVRHLWTDYLDVDGFDKFVNFLLRRHNPRTATRSYELCRLSYLSVNLTSEAIASIKQPVLLLHGDNDNYNDVGHVQEWVARLTGAKEVEAYIIPDAPHTCWVTQPALVTSYLSSFLARHASAAPSAYTAPDFPAALQRIAALTSNPKAALRNPHKPESFSSLTEEEKAMVAADLERVRGYEAAWRARPLVEGSEGLEPWEEQSAARVPRPRWRWSRRNDEIPSSPRNSSARFSIASEVVVQIASSQSAEKVSAIGGDIRPMSIVEVNVLPRVSAARGSIAGEDGAPSDDESEEGEEGGEFCRKDSGFVDALEEQPGHLKGQHNIVEGFARVALAEEAA
ncbi:hypothetical protein JCM10450v2_001327 [Rhodotorula kratochvilovae]